MALWKLIWAVWYVRVCEAKYSVNENYLRLKSPEMEISWDGNYLRWKLSEMEITWDGIQLRCKLTEMEITWDGNYLRKKLSEMEFILNYLRWKLPEMEINWDGNYLRWKFPEMEINCDRNWNKFYWWETWSFLIGIIMLMTQRKPWYWWLACIPGLSSREKMLGSRLIANYVSRTVYINTEVSDSFTFTIHNVPNHIIIWVHYEKSIQKIHTE